MALHATLQMALAIHYMHENKVLHRDIKAQNIFLLGNGRLVLGDLGISKMLDGTMAFAKTQVCNTLCSADYRRQIRIY